MIICQRLVADAIFCPLQLVMKNLSGILLPAALDLTALYTSTTLNTRRSSFSYEWSFSIYNLSMFCEKLSHHEKNQFIFFKFLENLNHFDLSNFMNGWVVQTVFWEISVLPITKSTHCQYRNMMFIYSYYIII